MNFRERLLNPPQKQFPMNGSWAPVTPEKPILIRSQPMSPDWQENQMGRMNLQEIDVPGSGYLNEMLRYNGPDQNLHQLGLLGQPGWYNNFDGGSAERNRIINHIAGSSTQVVQYDSKALNSDPLELLLMRNATNIASANRNLDLSISMAAARPLLPKFHPQTGSGEKDFCPSGFMLNQSNNYSGSSTAYNDLNRLNIPSRNPEFDSGSSDSLLNNNIHCSVSNPLMSSFCDIPQDGSYIPHRPKYDLNFAPVAETDAALSFMNSLQSIPVTLDQLNKFADNQLCTVAESQSQEKDKHEILAMSTENEIHKYCDGLLQHIVDSSSAAISISDWGKKDSESDNCDRGTDLGIDLNKTPEQKAPKRKKHRPKVIVEGKPKRTPNPATQKKAESKENPPKKRKYVRKNVPKEAATPQADIMRETESSNATTIKSCRKALNFDLEKSRDQSQSKMVCQQEIQHRDKKAFDITSDYQAAELLNGANTTCGTNSVLLVSNQEALQVENQQYRNTEGITHLLNQKLTDTFLPEKQAAVALPMTTEEQQIENLPVTEKDPDQGNTDLYQERNNGCMQQYSHAEGIGSVHFLSATDFENLQMAKELMPQNSLQLVPNILSNSTEGRGSKRKHCHGAENQHVFATNQLGSSLLCQEIFQVDESCNGTNLDNGFFKTQKRKKAKNRLPTNVYGRSCRITTNDSSQEVQIKGKNESQSQCNDEIPNCCIERKRSEEKRNTGAAKHTGAPNQTYPALIDDIICQLEGLNLRESNISEMEGQNAIVPYKGSGSIVPFEEFAKKRKARPKVDLDPETERIWKLLMGKEGSEGLQGTDKEKEKWWEEERKVFHGRVDSFIARMHLVQGDRRFSRWKGSVVDSVIGVFLTQNVSDHLSSSAFMSLAARFPLASTSNKRASDIVGTNGLFEEPEVCIVNPDDAIISYGRLLSQPTYHHSFVTPHVTKELWSEASGINRSIIDPKNQISEDEIISSQDSLDSSITQGTGGIRSCSGSNSEAEGPPTGCKPRKTQYSMSEKPLQVEKTTMFEEFYNSVNGVSLFDERTKDGPVQLAEYATQKSRLGRNDGLNSHSAFSHLINFGSPPKQALIAPSTDYELNDSEARGLETFRMMHGREPSWPETASIFSQLQETNYRRFTITEVGGSVDKSTEQQYRSLGSPELPTMDLYGPFSKHLIDQQNFSQSRSHACHQQSSNHHLVDKKAQPGGTFFTDSESTSKKLGRGQDCRVQGSPNIPKHTQGFDAEGSISAANRQTYLDNSMVEPESQERVYSSGLIYKESKSNVSKAKKVKPNSEKNNAVDWDNLRKQAQATGRKKERSKDTMDSLDYEAVRCAPVKEISEAIKERGMNNMLAERIKEFLNRLVRDHGSIDLEWLRDVPPDKAKDYLLSIRGLGLKSVECVRLLTLHHLAFPVDTNVGRIAVRLGWVPLRPLPESLQLHLLELYPMLESIQKYLWPRLCKLDQRTLYELHYQMITFGKVFCTKSKPNCNACPMRAECRHFASAFASARLALPGPQEKGIVSIPVPFAAQRNPVVNMNPVPLSPLEYNLLKEVSSRIGNCEPIIEEPATPEQECIESLESDIEDSFCEDPNEIPTIKLNLETFSMNVRNCVQGNRELHECDMSKALVVLNQEAASIPTPKLKNVSRLRTEHQVYELPDSHPLLEKMDKREPDDPSPYLLAIWTPGETANSIEPPERRCISQDTNHMCNDKTCFACNSIREANSQTVRGTILIPCRTATRGSFPLNGTYFQVNEVFADHASSIEPLHVPREWLWNLPRRTVYFGTSVSTIFKGLSTQGIQHCFWRGFVCVRGFDQQTHAPRPLKARLHFPASKLAKAKK